jgi:hypothetical protein
MRGASADVRVSAGQRRPSRARLAFASILGGAVGSVFLREVFETWLALDGLLGLLAALAATLGVVAIFAAIRRASPGLVALSVLSALAGFVVGFVAVFSLVGGG